MGPQKEWSHLITVQVSLCRNGPPFLRNRPRLLPSETNVRPHSFTLSFLFFFFQPAHVKACFLGSNLTVPVSDGKLNLGTWQGVWLCEHRDRAGSRKVLVTVNGALRDPVVSADSGRTPQSPSSPIASTSS